MELAGFSEEMTGLLRLGGGSGVPPVGSLLSSASAFSSLPLHRPQFLSHRNSGEKREGRAQAQQCSFTVQDGGFYSKPENPNAQASGSLGR